MVHSSSPFVSVIIPVFNDAERLKICLEAIDVQTYPKSLYEVIVVDNGSDEGQNIKGVVEQFTSAIATYESTPGSYAARNRGISLAKGKVIAFTDADCIPALDWLEKGVKNLLAMDNCGLVAGKVNLFFKNPQQPTPVELYESITAFPQERLLNNRKAGATANVFTFKAVFDRVGLFNANLKSNGDMEWGKRVYEAGYQQIYAEDTCVAHPTRYSWADLYKRTVRLAGGVYNLYIKPDDHFIQRQKMFARLLFDSIVPPVNFAINAFQDSRLQSFEQKIKVSLTMCFVRYVSAWELTRLKLGGTANRG
ncbi:MAG: glycosyltransferase [Richelia sp. RM2_1_2]|nr:glycosyltransferase [Richelia sp. SM1_7_0]NJN06510.1 glycosyltransferase [Richelia sp. RM1_1_1]NJO26278.1 glycosyltransferase [Richelia sp. SL_2_1]NJO58974.1 glycosyltransferase [Richelia sp. RM2_1_2]